VESPAFVNSLNTNSLKAGTLDGYTSSGAGANVSVVDNEGMGGAAKAIKLKSGSSAAAPADLKFVTPSIPVVPGHEYEVVFYIKSDVAGEGRIAFEGLKNNTPQKDWMNTGKNSEKFVTGPGWKRVRFRISDFESSSIKLHFDLGYAPNVTYLLDVQNLYVYDTQGEPLVSNLVANGDFEAGTGWGGWGNNSTRGITATGMGLNNAGKAFFVTNPSTTSGYWVVQTSYELPKPLDNAKAYKLSFWVKGTAAGVIRPELQSPDYSSNAFGTVNVSTDWQLITLTTTATAATRSRMVFSYGEFAGTVYIDNVVLSTAVAVGGTTIVQKNAAEKEAIIAGELERWISGMVTHAAPKVKAWEVLTEPMDDAKPAELRSGVGRTLAADEFYWQDYLGKDYGLKAFQLARKYGNDKDLLFIHDSNLEQNLDKCRGLISYVAYLESKGAKVDGISTQMNISLDTDKQAIVTMFQLLAATGKKIRISGLNVAVGVTTDKATLDQYQAQKDMYQYVVAKYFELVPASQRYGITVFSPLDSPANAAWRAKEPIGLWTEGFNRKPAYSGFAEGLKALK
jgi:endo-1,4-beta-xylanase